MYRIRNTATLFVLAAMLGGFALVCWFAEPRIPEEGMWILLKLMTFLGKLGCLAAAGVFLVMGLMRYTGFHHGKGIKKAGAISEFLFYGGYLLIAASVLTVIICISANAGRTIFFVALGVGPAGVLALITSYFFGGAESGSKHDRKNTDK